MTRSPSTTTSMTSATKRKKAKEISLQATKTATSARLAHQKNLKRK
jgi:hypothetical protein